MEYSDNEDDTIHGSSETRKGTNKLWSRDRKSITTDRKPTASTLGGNGSSVASNVTRENATRIGNVKTRSEIMKEKTESERVGEGNVDNFRSDQDKNANAENGKESYGAKVSRLPNTSRYTTLPHCFAAIALAVALYTQLVSLPKLEQCTPLNIVPVNEMKDILKRLASVESSIKETTVNIKDIEKHFKSEKDVYKDGIASLKDQFKRSEQSLMHQVSEKVEELENLKNQFQEFEKQVAMKHEGISVIKNEQNELKTNFVSLEEKLEKQSKDVEKNNAEVAKEISQHKEDVHYLNLSVKNLGSNMKLLAENVTGILIENLVLEKRTDDIKENTFDKDSLIVVIMINTVLLVVIIIYLVAKRDNNRHLKRNADNIEQEVNEEVNNSPAPYSTAGGILSQVRANPRLERSLCVISFYEETHPLHMQMTQSVTEQLTIQTVEFLIRRHEDILNIPPVCLFFLFVDFNERNVILEDPTLGLGDLRLTTVQAVQKMGGRIVIFYVRDQNSRQLGSTKLYNEDLVSVTRQRELSDLNRHSCFVSAYDTLTENQKTHLKRIVRNDFNVH